MSKINSGHHLEQFACQLTGRAYTSRAHVDLAWIGFGVSNELGDCFSRNGQIDEHQVGHADDPRNWRYVADKAELEIAIERRITRIRKIRQKERIAITSRIHDRLSSDVAACARPVLNDEWLPESLLQPLTHQTREDVVPAAGSIPDNPTYWPRRIGLRPRKSRHGRERGSARGEMGKNSAGGGLFWPAPPLPP